MTWTYFTKFGNTAWQKTCENAVYNGRYEHEFDCENFGSDIRGKRKTAQRSENLTGAWCFCKYFETHFKIDGTCSTDKRL